MNQEIKKGMIVHNVGGGGHVEWIVDAGNVVVNIYGLYIRCRVTWHNWELWAY